MVLSLNVKLVVLATGTYLRARIIIGDVTYNSGPNGLAAANELTQHLMDLRNRNEKI